MRNGLASVAWLAERLGQPNLRVVDATGAPLSDAAVLVKTSDEWINLKQGVQDIRVPGGGELRKVHFDALLEGHLLEKEHACDLRATYDEDEPTLVLLKLFPLKLQIRVTDGMEPARDARITIMGGDGEEKQLDNRDGVCETSLTSVSYTHLTLPTILLV